MKKTGLLIIGIILGTTLFGQESGSIERFDIPFKGEKDLSVKIEYGMGSLDLRGGDEYLCRAGLTYVSDQFKPSLKYKKNGESGSLYIFTETKEHTLDDESVFELFKDASDNEYVKGNNWKLEFLKTIPIKFDIEFGMGEGRMDFSGIMIEELTLECGMSDVDVFFNERNNKEIQRFVIESGLGSFNAEGLGNANIRKFKVDCGLGGTNLRFDGDIREDMRGKVGVGLGSVEIEIPRKVGIQVKTESSFLSSIDLDDCTEIDDDLYQSDNWDEIKYKIYLSIEVGLGSVNVKWIE